MQSNLIKHHTEDFHLFTPSTVDFLSNGKSGYVAVLDGQWDIPVDRRSGLAGQLKLGVDRKLIETEFLDGKFFMVDDDVVDYRLKSDLSFVHSDDSIKSLAGSLGFARSTPSIFTDVAHSKHIYAQSSVERFDCNATDTLGGQFDINIGFTWSPFASDISSFIEMWRQVCTNGAIAQSPIMNHRIPMLNKWEENLQISNQVLRHNFDKIVFPRLAALPNERISLDDMKNLMRIVSDLSNSTELAGDSIMHLANISDKLYEAWDPAADVLKSNVLKFIQAPITAFDAMNIATEASTHHVAIDRTGHRAQAFANKLIFNESRQRNLEVDLSLLVTDTNTFRNVDTAFFGQTCH